MPPIRGRRGARDPEDSDEESTQGGGRSSDAEEGGDLRAPSSVDVMVKKLVRLALACEYSRQPIRRTDINAKVFGEQGTRQFRTVFDRAQQELRALFGMQMVELPAKEKVTIRERRAAQRVEKPSTTAKSWILCSTLPSEYRSPAILPPNRAPSTFTEASYTALYTFIISLITLCGGSISEQKLERYLQRTNAETYTPVDRTDRLLQRMCKEGYLVRTRETEGGEEMVEYMVGPRGKIEVGEAGVAGLVRTVYGRNKSAEGDEGADEEADIFERKLERSLAHSRRFNVASED
ncbi:hypothetical protein VTN31DRAFT_5574 [Thermomyces dupontii]|uniref:uncharacterized protein n=1 Tax=Talaromyces thermophilus TaxID=28565 RepID=UPI003741ED30